MENYEQLIQGLQNFDENLFLTLNACRNAFFDFILPLFTNKKFWIPLYLVALIYAIKNYRGKLLLVLLLAVFAAVGLSDFVSVNLFKNVFERLRPCHVERIRSVQFLHNNHCGGWYGFVSSHASNHMALAMVLPMLFSKLKQQRKQLSLLFVFWAILIAYSRVYVGVHYPFDVIVGALLGASIGLGCRAVMLFATHKLSS